MRIGTACCGHRGHRFPVWHLAHSGSSRGHLYKLQCVPETTEVVTPTRRLPVRGVNRVGLLHWIKVSVSVTWRLCCMPVLTPLGKCTVQFRRMGSVHWLTRQGHGQVG